ncbi:MAG: tetratricopeptide repeat protein [Opitutales bacterium]|jgi:tetratricopeptide (TPR) repeat protein
MLPAPCLKRTVLRALVTSLVIISGFSGCVPQSPPIGESGQIGGTPVIISKDDNYGVSFVVPKSLPGQFDRYGDANLAFTSEERSVTVLFLTDLAGQVPDDYAMACACIRGFNVPFPGDKIRQLETTEKDGQRWLHYEMESWGDKGHVFLNFDIARKDNVLACLITISFIKGMDNIHTSISGAMWKFVHLDSPPPEADLSMLPEKQRKISSDLFVELVHSYMERNRPQDAMPYAQRLCELRPAISRYAEMLADVWLQTKDYQQALDHLDIMRKTFPLSSGLVWRRATALGELGRKEEALAEFRKAITGMNDKSSGAIHSYLEYLNDIDELGADIDEVQTIVNTSGDPEIQYYLAKACVQSGDKERAAKIIDAIVDKCEAYPQLADPIVSIYLELENYDEALAICKRVIEQNNPLGYYLGAVTLMREGRFKEAREMVTQCIEKMPNNNNAKQLLDSINAQMGKADSSSFQTKIEPVALPEDFESLIAPEREGMEEGFGCRYVYNGVLYDFTSDQRIRTTYYCSYHVSGVEAIRRMNDLRFPFDPLYERIFVNYLHVFDKDGNKIAEGELSNYYTANDPDEVLMSQKKELHMPVPSLTPGCSVEYAVTYETLGKQKKMPFKMSQLSRNDPTQLSFVGVRGEVSKVLTETANDVMTLPQDKAGDDLLFYYINDPMPSTYYPGLPPPTEYVPTVWISSTEKTWKSETDEYYDMVKDLDDASPEVEAKVKEILGEEYTPDEAVHKLSAFVRESLTYHGIEFGLRAMIPNTCADILQNRYGDCKDHAYLLMKMLRAAGVDANLALVDTSLTINTKVPDSGQFDHMIVYLPKFHGGHFIDATGKGSSDSLEPMYLEGSPTLILDKDDPRIVNVPANPEGSSGFKVDRTVKIDESGSALVTEHAVFTGRWAGMMRNALRDKTPDEYAPILLNSISLPELSAVRVIDARNLDNLDQNVEMEYSYRIDDAFTPVNGKLLGIAPTSWEAWELRLPNDQPTRVLPIWQHYNATFSARTTFLLPEGYSMDDSPAKPHLDLNTPYISMNLSGNDEGNSIVIDGDYTRTAAIFQPTERDAREKAYAEALKAIRTPIVLVKKQP